MDWFSEISVKWVLFAIGVAVILIALLRLTRTAGADVRGILENLQVAVSVVVVVFLIIRPFLFQAFFIPSASMEKTLLINDRLIVDKLVYRVSNPRRSDIVVFKAPPAASPDEKDFIKRTIGLPNETVEVVPPRLRVDNRTLAALGSYSTGYLTGEKPRAQVDPSGSSAVVSGIIGSDVKVIAAPDAQVEFDSHEIRLDGIAKLSDPRGTITETSEMTLFNSDPALHARVFAVSGMDKLIVVRGRRLSFDPGHVLVNGQRLSEPYEMEAPLYGRAIQTLGPNEYFMMGDNRNNSDDSHVWGPLTRDRVIGRAEVLFWPLDRLHVFSWWLLTALAGLLLGYHAIYRVLGGR